MWLVVFRNNKRHSAWTSALGARNQIRVLKDYGYRIKTHPVYDSTLSCEDGHYYV